MSATALWVPYRTNSPFFSTFFCLKVNVDVQSSSHICPVEISAPDCRWDKMCAVLALVDNKGLRLSYALWVAYMRIPYGRVNRGPFFVLALFTQCVSTLV